MVRPDHEDNTEFMWQLLITCDLNSTGVKRRSCVDKIILYVLKLD